MTAAMHEDLSMADLWDSLREESLQYWESHDETWPSSPEEVFQDQLRQFADKVMEGPAEFTPREGYTIVSGTVKPRWCIDEGAQSSTSFVVRHSPFRGEIVMLETSTLLACLNTNCFLRQWTAAWCD